MANKDVADKKKFKIAGEVFWYAGLQPNEMSGVFQVDICNLSKAAVEKLEGLGVSVRHKDEQGFFITCKSAKFPIVAYTTDGDRIPAEVKIGNGSKCIVTLDTYAWTFKAKKGVSATCVKLTITDLIEYNGNSDDDAEDVDGVGEELESDVI
jgi:hypothetical protein